MTDQTWTYRNESFNAGGDMVGYDVEATDGSIGKIDKLSDEASSSYVVVDTGFWIFGKKRLVPAGAISDVEHDRKVVRVQMTKEQIKSAPDFDSDKLDDAARTTHADYYRGEITGAAPERGEES